MDVPLAASFALLALSASSLSAQSLSPVGSRGPQWQYAPHASIDTRTQVVSRPGGPLRPGDPHVCPSPLRTGWHPEGVAVPAPGDGGGGSDGALGSGTNGSRVQVISEFDGTDQQASMWVPADPDLAVSGTHVVEVVNENIAFFTKTGTSTYANLLNSSDPGSTGFFEPVGAGPDVFDPKVVYDAESGRFFVVALERTATQSFLYLGVSDDSDPNGSWSLFATGATYFHNFFCTTTGSIMNYSAFFDYPGLAVDSQAVYVTGNLFTLVTNCPAFPPGMFVGTRIRVFDKASLLGGLAAFQDVDQGAECEDPASIQPAESLSTSSSTYLVNAQYGGSGSAIRIGYVDDPLGTPQYLSTDVSVPDFFFPGGFGVPQAGTSILLDPSDARIMNAVWRDDELYFTHSVYDGTAGRMLARWYQYDTDGATLTQVGEIDPGPGIHTFYPAIAVDGPHEVALVFARSSATELPSIALVARRPNDPAGTMSPPKSLHKSTASYLDLTGSRTTGVARWGDYFGIGVEPGANNRKFWCVGEWASSSFHWETRIGRFKLANIQML